MIVLRLHSRWSKILMTWTFTNLAVPRLAEILIPIANSMKPFGHCQRHEFMTCGRNSRYVNKIVNKQDADAFFC